MIAVLNPKTVIPVHFGTFEHYKEPAGMIMSIGDDRIRLLRAGESIALSY